MADLKTRYKVAGAVVIAGVVIFGAKLALDHGIIPKPASMASLVPVKVSIPTADVVQGSPQQTYALSANPATNMGDACPTVQGIPWNAEGSLMLANGGPTTTANSLVKQFAGGCLKLERQDDYGQMQNGMLKFAQGRAQGKDTPDGVGFSIIMGDALSSFASTLSPQLAQLKDPKTGKGQALAVVAVMGFSYGEDKCMAPDVHGDPQKAKGYLIAAVPRDGDWNVCVKWASDNGIAVNTDNAVYDPDAINFVDTNSFTEADDKFVAGACEDLPVAHKGIRSNEPKRHVCVNGVATWTPGDVTVVQKRGGVVSLASTREYSQQMPAILIGNADWMREHRAFVVGVIKAIDRAAFQIRGGGDGLSRMAAVNAAVWGAGGGEEADPNYWAKNFVGQDMQDKTGVTVHVGGSRVSTLAEVRDFLGLGAGSYNVYKGVYNAFGKYYHTFYPDLVKDYPKYEDVVDTSYIAEALKGVAMNNAVNTQFAEHRAIQNTVSKKAFAIEFDTGKATIRSASLKQLYDIADQVGMTGLRIRIDGYTDNQGSSDANVALSRARAQAVASWLTGQAPQAFPSERIQVRGYGDNDPVADNATAEGRQKNRRVEVILGS
jgi:OOP family OmpA-OmpF porin